MTAFRVSRSASERYGLAAVGFALAGLVLYVFVVGEETAACAYACADEGSLAAAQEAAYDSSARGSAAYELGLGVVVGVMVVLLAPGALVRLLAEAVQRGEDKSGEGDESGALKSFHGRTFREGVGCGCCGSRRGSGPVSVRVHRMRAVRGRCLPGDKSSVMALRCRLGECNLKGTMRAATCFSFGFPYRYWWPVAESAV